MAQRITGLETEYGLLVQPPLQAHEVLPRVRDWIFQDQRYGLIDLQARGWDEPAGNGGFLFNGGRVYIDMGHMEYCTPECSSALDVVRYDRAGDELLLEALHALRLDDKVSFIRNNVDHYTGATFGCHENYSLDRKVAWTEPGLLSLLAFLTLRVLFTGAGRVGSNRPSPFQCDSPELDRPAPFQISQRADFIVNDYFHWVQHSRAIINLRDEPLADARRFRRLHLIHGDTNVLPATLFLKVGATRLVLDLFEADELPPVVLADPVSSFRLLSRRLRPPWSVVLAGGSTADVLELLNRYRDAAERMYAGRDAETDAILGLWRHTIEALGTDPTCLVGTLDWVSKEFLLGQFCQNEGLEWDHPWLKSQDLEFHHIDPRRSFGLALAGQGGFWSVDSVEEAKTNPPRNSRAKARSRLMRAIQGKPGHYHIDWSEVTGPDEKRAVLTNPFQT